MSDSFAYFHLPDSTGIPEGHTDARFEVAEWLAPYSDRRIILNPRPISAGIPQFPPDAHRKAEPVVGVSPAVGVSKAAYLAAVESIIASCKARDGKTVFSRIIEGVNPTLSPAEAARELAAAFPDAFTFLFSTPETGCWLGASPETLLNFDYTTRRIETMAYAGTRPLAGDAPWDSKNLRENRFVVDHIVEKFRQLGIEPSVTAPYASTYGDIQHLRCDITAQLPPELEFHKLLDHINPTPALCGTPTPDAIADINRYESAPRGCYGGFVALHLPGQYFRAYVCLRCAQLLPGGRFKLHTGGGITPDSFPLAEFNETEAKASPLLKILTHNPSHPH